MFRRTYFFVLAVVCGFSVCGYCTVVSEVDWHGGEIPPSEEWIIWPENPTFEDGIHFSGPTEVGSNACFAEIQYGYPTLTIDHNNKTVELWFEWPGPFGCLMFWAPVCGLEGQFGPLEEGEWVFFSNSTFPYPPFPGPILFSIDFSVTAASLVKLDSPNGGEFWVAGSRHLVQWDDLRSEDTCPGTYVMEYSTDGGQTWETEETVPGRCSLLWTVPDVNSQECLVRVYDSADPEISDQSDNVFTIYQCTESFAADHNVDCYVNGYDYALFAWWWGYEMAEMSELAEMASTWLECSNPYDPDCID